MNRSLRSPISQADIEAYKRDGVVCLRNQFDQDWRDRMSRASLRHIADTSEHERVRWSNIANAPPDGPRMCLAETNTVFRDFLFLSPLAAIARAFMEVPEVRYFYDQLFVKKVGVKDDAQVINLMTQPTPWHQDMPYWPFVGGDIISIWVPFTAAPREAAGLEYVAGSHRWGEIYAPMGLESTRYTTPMPTDLLDGTGSYNLLSWDMQAGDCLIHHPLTVHRSFPNSSADLRISVSVRFFGDDAVYDPEAVQERWYPASADIRAGRPTSPLYFPVVP